MKSLQQWLNTDDVFAAQAGARITKIEEDMAQANMTVHSSHLNAGGVCQGGALFTLADLALAAVMNSEGHLTLSLQTNIIFHASAHTDDRLTATAQAVHHHHRVPTFEVRITNQDEQLIATLTAVAYRKQQNIDSILNEH